MNFIYSFILLFPTIEDIREKRIRIIYPILMCVTKGIVIFLDDNLKEGWINSLVGLFIAAIISIVVLLLSKGGLGLGDVFLMGAMGFCMEIELFLSGLLVTSIISTLFSVFLLATKKANKDTKLPFVPFLFAGNVVATALEVLF